MKIKKYLLALCSAIALLINSSDIYSKGLKTVFDYRLVLILMLSFIIYFVFKKYDSKKTKYSKICSLIFCLFLLIGNAYECYGTIKGLYRLDMIPWTIIKSIGFYCIINFFICLIQNNISKYQKKKDIKDNFLVKRFNSHPLLFCLCTLAICWSIYYIAYYPIVLSPDPSFQIKQFLGEKTKYMDYSILLDENVTITNHHPVFHTVLIGSFAKLGIIIGNDNFGLFLYSLLQGLFMAFTLSSTICLLKQKGIKNKYLFLMLGIYALVPMFPIYAINGNKDVYYSLFVLWLMMFLFKYVDSKKEQLLSFKECFLWLLVLLFICLFRNNGSYLVIILFPFVLFYKKINFKRILAIFSIVLCLFYSYKNVLIPSLGITGGSVREMMSIFFQQTARDVINNEQDYTIKDIQIIDNIIDYENMKENYDPVLADPVKNTYNKYASSEDLKKYFGVWFKGLIKHPMTYIDATLNNVYGYFDPEDINWYSYTKYDTRITNLVDYHYNELNGIRSLLTKWIQGYPYIPVLGLISNIGFSTWIFIAIGVWCFMNKRKDYVIILIPMIVSLLVCIASPVNTYFRYAMPNVFAIPFIVGIWFYLNKKRTSK